MDFKARIEEFGERAKREAKEFNKKRVDDEAVEPQVPVDYYRKLRGEMLDESKKAHPHGVSTLTKKIAEEAIGELAKAKKRVEADSEYWDKRGDKTRADLAKQQYMEERFLPAVEMVIIASTPDEVLNAKEILSEFDKQTFEYGPGYTASYIRTAYGDQLGNAAVQSDGYVRDQVQRLHYLASSDQIRAAYGVAKKLKDEIDGGEHTASDDDYEVIARVATLE